MGLTQKLGTIPLAILTDASNNVGIGAAPSGSYKLEVTGTAKVSSTLLLGGALTGTSATFAVSVNNSNTGLDLTNNAGSGYGNSVNFYQSTTKFGQIFVETSAANTSEMSFKTMVGSTLATRLFISSTGAATFSSPVGANIAPVTNYGLSTKGLYGLWIQRASVDDSGVEIYHNGTNAIFNSTYQGTGSFGGILFYTSSAPRLTILSGGNVGIGLTSPSSKLEISQTASATWSTIVRIAPTTGACYGVLSTIQNQSPNNTSSFLYYGDDNTAARFIVYSNGGIANYTANNNPLSDERLKKEITPLESVWDKVKAIEVVKYKFNDQTHDDFNMGVIAQQVEMVAPELVNLEGWGTLAEDGTPYKSIWENDMNYYTMKALQEAMTKIEELNERLNKAGL